MDGSKNSYLIGVPESKLVRMYGTAGTLPSHQLIINPDYQVSKRRSFDLIVKKQRQRLKKDESSGWIIRNRFSTRTQLRSYGILSRVFFDGVVRCHKPGNIIQVREEIIECETRRDNTIFDLYFSWDGMMGTNSKGGGAGFSMNVSVSWEDELKQLSAMDGVWDLGAKNCKGSNQLTHNLVQSKGTEVTFVLRYEMDVSVQNTPMSVSELHFEDPVNNFVKIVTR